MPYPALGTPRVAFHPRFPFHQPILDPIHSRLAADPELDCLLTEDLERIVAFDPHVLVQSEGEPDLYRRRLPGAMIVYTGHGFDIKNWGRTAMAASDFACVASPWMRDHCAERGWRPSLGYWATGHPPMDGTLRRIAAGEAGRPAGERPTLLYAPTFSPLLSSVEMLDDRWLDETWARCPQLRIVIKPHPHIPLKAPRWMARFEAWARADTRVRIADSGADFYTLMCDADVLLADVSSVIFYFLALDRPVVLLTNPRRAEDIGFNPSGPEWAWRDLGTEVGRWEDLPDAIEGSVRHPERGATLRARYRERVFGPLTDGRAAERIAARVRSLVRPSEIEREWIEALWDTFERLRLLRDVEASLSYQIARRLDRVPRLKRTVSHMVRMVLG